MGTICTMAATKQTNCSVYPPFNSSFFKESLLSKASTIANAPSLFISSKDKFSSFKLFTEVRKLLANALAPSVLTRQSPKLMTSRFLRLGSTYKTSACYKLTWFPSTYLQRSISTPESVLESGKITRNVLRQRLKDQIIKYNPIGSSLKFWNITRLHPLTHGEGGTGVGAHSDLSCYFSAMLT